MDENFDPPLPEACPPDSATCREQVAYRVVASSPPTEDDFLTHAQKGLAVGAPPCSRASISVFSTYESALHLRQMRPKLGNFIAKGHLTPKHGRISQPSSTGHMDWWAFSSMVNPREFTVTESGS